MDNSKIKSDIETIDKTIASLIEQIKFMNEMKIQLLKKLTPANQPPYVQEFRIDGLNILERNKYNPNFGDNRMCDCGHPYYRHFDTYDNMEPVGCKYCECYKFKEKK